MSVTRVGTTKQYSDNWENIFGGANGRTATKKQPKSGASKSAKKKAPKTKARKPGKKALRRS
jgi:hypothetical protein